MWAPVFSAAAAPTRLRLPLALSSVPAGFPSPATGHIDGALDLNALVVRRPSATFFVRVQGESMRDAGIYDGDLLVIDRAESPTDGAIILAVLDGEFTVKRWRRTKGKWTLHADHPDYPPIDIGERDFAIWGVVTHTVRTLAPRAR